MSPNKAPQARLTTVATFPKKYFLENLAVRSDNSVLITAMNHHELWFVPPFQGGDPVEAKCIHTFEHPVTGIVEVDQDIFYLLVGELYTTHEAYLYSLDLRGWTTESPVQPKEVCPFPKETRGPNGCCLVGPRTMLVADCFASLIWRVDLKDDDAAPGFSVWLEHDSMGYFPGDMKPEQPGVNGVRYAQKSGYVYYTATAKKLLMRVAIDPDTLDAKGGPELVVAGRMGDDFCIDEEAEVIYLATHRQNTIDVISMNAGYNSGFTQSVAGDPFTEELIGPSGGAWARSEGDYGRRAFFIMDGGTASPLPDGPHPAKLLQVEFQPLGGAFPGVTK
ncbi:hypothetical protein FV242_26860 [Methylobacterium sp. WL64]|uniref:hypothetical protein n=1 Tax=Methylobacterium sp. WL64 TaxID=2603894 RepID=UPI0011CAAC6E|nr:hypothetical protein [Methylobacterium sp. WL64]TXM99026.1 hypothetical protein FV242_26860 [Methylobacterium sp. WL64]